MKEKIMIVASLIIIFVAIITVLALLYALVIKINEKQKAKELRTLRLAMKEGDEKAELKLKEQLIFFKKQVEDAENKLKRAEKQLQNFESIYDLFNPKNEEENQIVRLPKNLTRLSFEDKEKNYDIFLMHDELEAFLKVQKELVNQEQNK